MLGLTNFREKISVASGENRVTVFSYWDNAKFYISEQLCTSCWIENKTRQNTIPAYCGRGNCISAISFETYYTTKYAVMEFFREITNSFSLKLESYAHLSRIFWYKIIERKFSQSIHFSLLFTLYWNLFIFDAPTRLHYFTLNYYIK